MTVISFHRKQSTGNALIQSEVNRGIWSQFLQRLPRRDDIISLLVALEDICKFQSDESKPLALTYAVSRQLCKDANLHEKIRADFLSPSLYLQLANDPKKTMTITSLVRVMTRSLTEQGLYASLARFSIGDASSESIMSIDALEDWLYQQSQRLVQIRKMTEQFLPLWVFTAAHTVAFFHGQSRASKLAIPVPGLNRINTTSISIKIRDFVAADTMSNLQQLSKPFLEEMDLNPFSRLRAVRYYDSFTVFEAGPQCNIFAGGYMNPVFMESLMDTYGGAPMDYRRFLTFAIAWDNRKSVPGVKYFWPIFDPLAKGFICLADVTKLVRGMLRLLQCLPSACGPQGPQAEYVLLDEIRDIVRTHGLIDTEEKILSHKDALAAPAAFASLVGLLGNTQTFIEYECREDTAHKQFVTKQVKEARAARLQASQLTRAGQLAILQEAIDECWFHEEVVMKFPCFAEFLDHHESQYGGESMEPWLARYYEWEQQEAENCQLQLLESQYVLSENDDSISVIHREDDVSDLVELRE